MAGKVNWKQALAEVTKDNAAQEIYAKADIEPINLGEIINQLA